MADALATAGAVLGPAKILELTKALGGQVLVLVDEDGTVREIKTEGWQAIEATAEEQ